MVHGTWGWKGDWWRPGKNFHQFILGEHRQNLYSGGAKFSWSGALSDSQRRLAAKDFCEWADDRAPGGLQTIFAHSYGGEVAGRAVLSGARVDELVLLSVPVTRPVAAAARSGVRVVDVRLPFDAVLGLARQRQRIPTNPGVMPVLLKGWRYGHGASHDEDVWRQENVAQRGGI
jgi:pimeloyl-ACP methyl ester carboxylesterase